jgi:hypothetical protein
MVMRRSQLWKPSKLQPLLKPLLPHSLHLDEAQLLEQSLKYLHARNRTPRLCPKPDHRLIVRRTRVVTWTIRRKARDPRTNVVRHPRHPACCQNAA